MSGSGVSVTSKNDKGEKIDGSVEFWTVFKRMKMYYKPEASEGRCGRGGEGGTVEVAGKVEEGFGGYE